MDSRILGRDGGVGVVLGSRGVAQLLLLVGTAVGVVSGLEVGLGFGGLLSCAEGVLFLA